MLTLVLVQLTAHFSNRQYAFLFFFLEPAGQLVPLNLSDCGTFLTAAQPSSQLSPFPSVSPETTSYFTVILWLCVLELVGPLLSLVKRQILFWQACWRNNLLIMFFSRTDHALWSVCVGSFTPLTMTCMYLRAKRSCGWLVSHARTSAPLLFVVPSSHLSETCCGRFPCDFRKHEMRLEFPPQARMVFSSFCCFYRKHLLAFSVLLQFQLHSNRVNRC